MNSFHTIDWYLVYLPNTEQHVLYPIALPPHTLVFLVDDEIPESIDRENIVTDYVILNQDMHILDMKPKISTTGIVPYHISLYRQHAIHIEKGARIMQQNGRCGTLTKQISVISTNNARIASIFEYVYILAGDLVLGNIYDIEDCTYWKQP